MMLGLCISAITTGSAFAKSITAIAPVATSEANKGDLSDDMKALYEKQSEVDQAVFTDHAKEIADKGITINYTGVMDSYVEVGIYPYTDDNSNYLYELLGKDKIKVVAFDMSVIYETTVAVGEPSTAGSGTTGEGSVATDGSSGIDVSNDGTTSDPDIYDVLPGKDQPEAVLYDTDTSTSSEIVPATDGRVYKGEVDPNTTGNVIDKEAPDDQVIYYTMDDSANPENTDIETMAASDSTTAVKQGADEKSEGISAPMFFLFFAGAIAITGGLIIITNKKKSTN